MEYAKTESVPRDGKGQERDNKGRFTSSGKKEKEDASVVKIKIIKEPVKKPLPPAIIKGKLFDNKEQTASIFLRSVITREPQTIDIDGLVYYSEEKVAAEIMELTKVIKRLSDRCFELVASVDFKDDELEWLYPAVRKWKALAIGAFIGVGVTPFITYIIDKIFR